MVLLKYLFGFLIFLSLSVNAQELNNMVIYGRVLEKTTGKPIENANVYILNSLKGSSTDKNGNYKISNMPFGKFIIVASHINYVFQKKLVNIISKETTVDFNLRKKIYELPQITVSGESEEEWKEKFNFFRDRFIGTSENAKYTKILNPYQINFYKMDNGWLKAEVNGPIIVENRALGYKIQYFLDIFEADKMNTKYSGQPHFEELTPDSEEEKNAWKENRIEAYCGSLRHFLHCISKQYLIDLKKYKGNINNENNDDHEMSFVENQGFEVFIDKNPFSSGIDKIVYPVNTDYLLSPGPVKSELYLKFDSYLVVRYNRQAEEPSYLDWVGENRNVYVKESFITLNKDSVLIDTKGKFYDPFGIHTYGYWAFERLADELPFEFSVPDTMAENITWVNSRP